LLRVQFTHIFAHGPYDKFSHDGEKSCKLLNKDYYIRKTPCFLLRNILLELPCEGPAQNGALDDAVPMDTGICIIDNPEIHPSMNQSLPEITLLPLEFPHPNRLIKALVSQPSVSFQSPLTMPSTLT